MARVILEALGDERTHGHHREQPNPLHALPHRRHELHGKLVGDLVKAEGIERALARAGRVVGRQEGKG
jgi:hypothetical protein